MALENLADQSLAFCDTDIGDQQQPSVWPADSEDERAEVLVQRHQDPLLAGCPLKQLLVAWIAWQIRRVEYVVALLPEPQCEATTRADVDQKPHPSTISIGSRRSLPITARAYARQARMSSSPRSG